MQSAQAQQEMEHVTQRIKIKISVENNVLTFMGSVYFKVFNWIESAAERKRRKAD